MRSFSERLFLPRSLLEVAQALRFYFGYGSGRSVDFDLCCDVLETRPDIFRLRCQYEFWLRDVIFAAPFSFETVPLPSIVSRELDFYPGSLGKFLATAAWRQPGIMHADLLALAREGQGRHDEKFAEEVDAALDFMEGKHYMSHQHGWYTTGRNPMRMRQDYAAKNGRDWQVTGGTLHWTRMFGRG